MSLAIDRGESKKVRLKNFRTIIDFFSKKIDDCASFCVMCHCVVYW